LHPAILALKKKIDEGPKDMIYDIDLTYISSRGHWYMTSWKSDVEKSGGIATNIGVHLFDMLGWIFGAVKENIVNLSQPDKAAGFLTLEKARVRWFLSIDYNDIPPAVKLKGTRTFRSILIDNTELEFSEGFAELHTQSYNEILSGHGVGLAGARSTIDLVYAIRNAPIKGLTGEFHPILKTLTK
jgi:UDP-N-acetyl-2-amino-2-deoxyglucuronate dehydrogenase